jgi:hypothetical protein
MRLFEKQDEPPAYYVIPDPEGEEIEHTYGCFLKFGWTIMGRVEPIPGPKGELIEMSMGCEHMTAQELEAETGLEVEDVPGEGLARLADGRYVVTKNCQ